MGGKRDTCATLPGAQAGSSCATVIVTMILFIEVHNATPFSEQTTHQGIEVGTLEQFLSPASLCHGDTICDADSAVGGTSQLGAVRLGASSFEMTSQLNMCQPKLGRVRSPG